jgi:hypothetical protein
MRKVFTPIIIFFISLTMTTVKSWGVVVHQVSNATELQDALHAAQSNGDTDIIRIAQGTYSGGFSYDSEEGYDIWLVGGYSADWSTRVVDPSSTILDGGNSQRVIWLNHTGGGGIRVEGLTIQNGRTAGFGAGLYLRTFSPDTGGHIHIINNIIRNNISTSSDGGGVWVETDTSTGGAGDIIFSHNIIEGNNAIDGGGIWAESHSTSGSTGDVVFINNILVGNEASDTGGGIYARISSSSGSYRSILLTNNTITENTSDIGGGIAINCNSGIANICNSIIRSNTATGEAGDISLSRLGSVYNVYNNNYSDIIYFNSSTVNLADNIDQNPHFMGGGDLSLQSMSPCIDKGTNAAPMLPSVDFELNPRIMDGDRDGTPTVDMGAFEYMPVPYIFDGHDFDGDTDSDIAVFRPSNGRWYIRNIATHPWGAAGDIPVNGDYNGDSITDIAVWRPTNGRWYIQDVGGTIWGMLGDIPVPGNYDGDVNGTTDIAVWRPSNGRWYILGMASYAWGTAGDIPVPGDYDGDGITERAVWRSSNGRWYIQGMASYAWGTAGDIPVPGDYNGDGTTDIAVWRSSNGRWYIQGLGIHSWGQSGDIPVPGDYNGDGTTDIAVWRPSNGRWYIKDIGNYLWGIAGDIPLVR